ncbi:MAG: hypothetical protein PHS59_18650 [Paludibacter sp.]|nr:hypothetical protein [Paludibacter sp.]
MNNPLKVLLNSADARALLRRGHRIVDIKPKEDDAKMTIFVFEATPSFMEDYEKLIKK